MIRCKNCAWFASMELYPEAMEFHQAVTEIFGDIFPRREGDCGICRKVTFCKERPVITNENGYCHRFEEKEETV